MKRKLVASIVLSLLFFGGDYSFAKEKVDIKPKTVIKSIVIGDVESVKSYISNGYDVNAPVKGKSILNYAIAAQNDEILDLLLQNGADPNAGEGVPSLYFAVVEKNKYAVAKLLKSGADKDKMYQNLTAQDLASTYSSKDILEIFNNYEENTNSFNPEKYKSSVKVFPKTASSEDSTSFQNTLNAKIDYSLIKKDTDLIKIEKTKPINVALFNQKKQKDLQEYQKQKSKLTKEQYQLYMILDKLIRSNNLQYQNWRIAMNIDIDSVNAHAGAANLIVIDSSLYDSLYPNIDALSFVIAHELAHLVLGHSQNAYENNIKIQSLNMKIQEAKYEANYKRRASELNNIVGNYSYAIGNNVASLAHRVDIVMMNKEIDKIYKENRLLETQADTEALIFMTKAGYNGQKAKEAISFLENLAQIEVLIPIVPQDIGILI